MKKFVLILTGVMIFIVTSSIAQNNTINLKFNLPGGSGYDYNMDMNISTKVTAGGQDVNVNNAMSFGYHFDVLSDSAGWKKMSATIARLTMNINAGGMDMNYDSDKPLDTSDAASAAMGKALSVIKGSQFTFTMNDKGDINSVAGIQEMMNNMQQVSPGSGTSAFGNAFDENNFKQNMKQAFGMYPDRPVKPGDTWTSTATNNSGGMAMNMNNVYTLESVSGNTANVKVESKISSSPGAVNSVDGTMSGTMNYDIPTGIVNDGELNMDMNMNVNQGGQSIPVVMNVKTKITGKKS